MQSDKERIYLLIKYYIPIGQIPGKYRNNSRGKKFIENYSRFTQVRLILSHTNNCVFDSLSDTTTHQQLGMLSKQTGQCTTEVALPGWQARKICISSLSSLSLRAPSQGVGSSRGKAVDHTLWSCRCQHRVPFHREKNKDVLIIYHMFYFYVKANHYYFYIPAFPMICGPWNPP